MCEYADIYVCMSEYVSGSGGSNGFANWSSLASFSEDFRCVLACHSEIQLYLLILHIRDRKG